MINGVSQSLSALARGFAPLVGGLIVRVSSHMLLPGGQFVVLAFMGLCGILVRDGRSRRAARAGRMNRGGDRRAARTDRAEAALRRAGRRGASPSPGVRPLINAENSNATDCTDVPRRRPGSARRTHMMTYDAQMCCMSY
jgi:hypothetical protein